MFHHIIKDVVESTDLQSLQHLAAVRVAISLCESVDVQGTIGSYRATNGDCIYDGFSDRQWKQLSGKVRRKLSKNGVPNKIIDRVLKNLWPVSFEIYKWIICHCKDTGINCPLSYCWTPQVNIDYVKTAEKIVRNEALDVRKRFKLACFHCLELEVRALWEQMSSSDRRIFYYQDRYAQNPIVLYWTDFMQRELKHDLKSGNRKKKNHTLSLFNYAVNNRYLFNYAVKNGYLSATKFFFGKLKFQIRTRMISNSFYYRLPKLDAAIREPQRIEKECLAITSFLICQLPSDYQGVTDYTFAIRYFLEWPLQRHIMTVVFSLMNHVRIYSEEQLFGYLLEGIIDKDIRDFKDYDYKQLFMEFWRQSPRIFKTYVDTNTTVGFKTLVRFVRRYFSFVFQENSLALKTKFRALLFQQEILEDVAEKENVEFFKWLVRERITTKSIIDANLNQRSYYFPNSLPLGELKYLIDGILETSPIQP